MLLLMMMMMMMMIIIIIIITIPLRLGDRMNFLHLTASNPTEKLGEAKVSQRVNAETT